MAALSDTLPDPFAEVSDLTEYWGKALSQAEQDRAAILLRWSAKRILDLPGSDQFDELTCAEVSMDMVKRAMGVTTEGVTDSTTSQSMAGMTASRTDRFANPLGNLYLTGQEIARLSGQFGATTASLRLSSNARVPGEPWNNQPSSQIETP